MEGLRHRSCLLTVLTGAPSSPRSPLRPSLPFLPWKTRMWVQPQSQYIRILLCENGSGLQYTLATSIDRQKKLLLKLCSIYSMFILSVDGSIIVLVWHCANIHLYCIFI